MPRHTGRFRALSAAVVVLLLAVLACGPLMGGDSVTVSITSPDSGSTVSVGESVRISSTASADAGVARVELLIDGEVVSEIEPPAGTPPTFPLRQSWVPLEEGEVTVSVVAYDAEGQASDPAAIRLNVVGSAAGVTPTPAEDVEVGDCTLNASFVADITIPDDTIMTAGASFVKGWRIENSGTCDWGPGFELVFVSGEQMGGPASVPVPPTPAGDTVDVSVDLVAPIAYGTHRGDWRIRSDEAQMFGSTFWVQVVVPAPATETPTPTETPLPTDTPAPTNTPSPTPTWFLPPITFAPITMLPLFPYVQHESETVTVPGGGCAAVSAVCPSGSRVVGGGYDVHWNVFVYSQYMPTMSQWRAAACNTGGSDLDMTVYAVCLRNVSATVSVETDTEHASPGHWARALATCPAGSVVTGGGWGVSSTGDGHVYNSSKSGNGWEVYAFNTGGTSTAVTARALCLEGTTASITEESNSITLGSGGVGEVECACSSGLNVSGGFAGPFQYAQFYITSPDLVVDGQWSNWARNTDSAPKNFFCYANCLSF
jgi:hypothetical protein